MKKKIFSKIYHPFLIKTICKLEIVGNLIKKNHKKSTAKITRNGQSRNVPEGRNKARDFCYYHFYPTLRHPYGKGRIELSLFICNVGIYMENATVSIINLTRTSKFRKLAGNKINIQKVTVSPYVSNEQI